MSATQHCPLCGGSGFRPTDGGPAHQICECMDLGSLEDDAHQRGFQEGFLAGYESGKADGRKALSPPPETNWMQQWLNRPDSRTPEQVAADFDEMRKIASIATAADLSNVLIERLQAEFDRNEMFGQNACASVKQEDIGMAIALLRRMT